MKSTANGLTARSRAALYASAAALIFAIPATAVAQNAGEAQPAVDQPAEDAGDGNEIIVTATKREQTDRKSTRLNSSHVLRSRMPSSA